MVNFGFSFIILAYVLCNAASLLLQNILKYRSALDIKVKKWYNILSSVRMTGINRRKYRMRTIEVNGTGTITKRPDTIEVIIELTAREKQHKNAMDASVKYFNALSGDLATVGFETKEIKTLVYRADIDYDNVRDKDGNMKRELKGYRVYHKLCVRFDYDMDRLSKILAKLSKAEGSPEFSVRFTAKDSEEITKQVIAKAVGDAKSKAEILSASANIRLGEIQSIQYNVASPQYYSNTEIRPRAMLACNSDMADMNPEDISVTDSVTILWEIR